MSELRTVPCNDVIELAPMFEEVFADLAPLAEKEESFSNATETEQLSEAIH